MTRDHDDKGDKRPFGKRPFDRETRSGDQPNHRAPRNDTGRDARGQDDKRAPRFSEDAPQDDGERIAKRLARAGIASRREAETMIAAGRIAVNGKILSSPAINVKRTDIIMVDSKPLPQTERTRLWLYHKPSGLVTTNRDPEGRPTVFESLPADMPRVLSVGRLDINTEGLLLLTNDGGLSRILELPTTGWLRRYRVRAHGSVTQSQLDELKNGIAVDGVFYGSVEALLEREQGTNVWLSVGLREGKNREVKNILGALGLTVSRLIRISFGPFQLGDLPEGSVQEIRGRVLRDQLGEKLIEESGADFDGPVLNEFSNGPVRGSTDDERPARRPREWISSTTERERPKGPRRDKDERPGARDERPARGERPDRAPRADKLDKGDRRDAALSRLSTSPKPGGFSKAGSKPAGAKPERELPLRRPRGVNVWMAPGARPQTSRPAREDNPERQGWAQGAERQSRNQGAERPARRERPSEGRPDSPYKQRDDRRDGDARPHHASRSANEARPHHAPRPTGDFQSRPRRNDDEAAGRSHEKRSFGNDRPAPRDEGDRRPRRDEEVKRPGKRERREAFERSGSDAPRSHGPKTGQQWDGPSRGPSSGPSRGPSSGSGKGPHSGPNNGPNTRPNTGPNKGPNKGPSRGPGGSGADRRR